MNDKDALRELAFEYESGVDGSSWRLADESWKALIETAVEKISQPEKILPADIIKKIRRRLIFRLPTGANSPAILVKAFPLDSLKHKLQHDKYAFSEAANLLQAARLNLPVPKVFAFGRRRFFGLMRWTVLCEEFIVGRPLRDMFANSGDPQVHQQALDRVMPLFQKIYEAGCNHVDFGPHAILMPENAAEPDRIIDFQYCRFLPRPSATLLAGQAGYFAWVLTTRRGFVDEQIVEDWFERLMDFLKLDGNRDALRGIFRGRMLDRGSTEDRLGAE